LDDNWVENFKSLSLQAPGKSRLDLVKDFVKTESEYLKNLQNIKSFFLVPLSTMQPAEFPENFSNDLQVVAEITKQFVSKLEDQLGKWQVKQVLGSVFTEYSPQFRLYKGYIINFSKFQEKIKKNIESNESVKTLFDEQEKKLENSIFTVLQTPLQRLPNYEAFLETIISLTPTDHVDYQDLKVSFGEIKAVNLFFEYLTLEQNQKNVEDTNMEKLKKLNKLFSQMDDLILEFRGENCDTSEAEALEVIKSKSVNLMNNLTQKEQAYNLKANAEKAKNKSKFYKPDKLDPSFYASYDMNAEFASLKNTQSEAQPETETDDAVNYVTESTENQGELSEPEEIETEDTTNPAFAYSVGVTEADPDPNLEEDVVDDLEDHDAGLSLYCGSVPTEAGLQEMENEVEKDVSDSEEEPKKTKKN